MEWIGTDGIEMEGSEEERMKVGKKERKKNKHFRFYSKPNIVFVQCNTNKIMIRF